jgi:uncharacterized repeat protein (TIGR03803 family)
MALASVASAQQQHEVLLHKFNVNDGSTPQGIVMAPNGDMFGATIFGGANNAGAVYKLVQNGDRSELTVIYSFSFQNSDGYFPLGNLILDSQGNIYGATFHGGAYNAGAVFELSPLPGGQWREKILHSFGESPSDGSQPWDHLYIDPQGNLFGTTETGGGTNCQGGCGTAYELSPLPGGQWKETIIFNFDAEGGADGLSINV